MFSRAKHQKKALCGREDDRVNDDEDDEDDDDEGEHDDEEEDENSMRLIMWTGKRFRWGEEWPRG